MKATRFLRCALLGGAVVALLSCGERAPLGVPRHDLALPLPPLPPVDPVVPSASLVLCSPLPYDSVTVTIGPAGGVLQVGPHALAILPLALDSAVSITAVAPSDTVNRVRLQPEGLTFHRPALLVMSYANCTLPWETGTNPVPGTVTTLALSDDVRRRLKIAYISPSLQILDYLRSLNDADSQTLNGLLRHFSDYAVAW